MSGQKIILVTEASGGISRMAANALAQGGHTVYAAMTGTNGANRRQANAVRAYARDNAVDLRPLELDVTSGMSVETAIAYLTSEHGRIDALVHNTVQPLFGPAEAFTPDQLATAYQKSVIGTQRLIRAVLPHMRRRREGLLVWLVSSASAGGTPPFLGFYSAVHASMDAIAVEYAREVARWGIETSIIVPGMFSQELSPLVDPIEPDDRLRAAEYEHGPYSGVAKTVRDMAASLLPPDAIAGAAAGATAMVVDTPFRERPFRIHVDPVRDGAEIVLSVFDRIREEMIRRLGLADLLRPAHLK